MVHFVTGWRAVPRRVWALGFVSLFTDVSSETIHVLLPVFLVTTLGASFMLVGVIERIVEGGGVCHQGVLRRPAHQVVQKVTSSAQAACGSAIRGASPSSRMWFASASIAGGCMMMNLD